MKLYNSRTVAVMLTAAALWLASGCRKTDYPTVANPAYVRVFNCLVYERSIDNKDLPQPFLTMLIDPQLDAAGVPVGAAITGDFLDTRDQWARPYPDAGNTSRWQKEYPGGLKNIPGPIVNGFDLSSYAQMPGGEHRIMFVTRPLSDVPFFSLNAELRSGITLDTTIKLDAGEIYTMNVLQRKNKDRKASLYVRQETFTKQPFSDTMVYVNFYNLSSEGFFSNFDYSNTNALPSRAMRDTMQVFYSLYNVESTQRVIPGYNGNLMTSLYRSQATDVHPYFSFPLFADTIPSRIYTRPVAQRFTFLVPGVTPAGNPYISGAESYGNYTELAVGNGLSGTPFTITADQRTGLVISIHSGIYNPRSFATVNTIEYINGRMFLTTIQRRYDPPVY
ncbi:MAG TPA: hypothetical protein VM802_04210 [Chitinophaga sp.]|uniref:hypothetical protein n=1 Tax=Chitinophaga sp. TaxID=1869181 RepID=UPI002BC081F8|nr:hypothetical protein [Chitinophaga sp.]HVI44041.1 hypothetical protein [Chitinophaga sp.]